jgi:HPt (histidine-containing phosphotransfer) domain-containing protein
VAEDTAMSIDLGVIETLRQLDDSGEMDLVGQLVGTFLDSAGPAHARVEAAVAAGDAKALAQAAHSLKSGAANLGALALSTCYRELEACGREGRVTDAQALLGDARREQARALRDLRRLVTETA